MECLPTSNARAAVRVIPLPVALYESNGLLFELYDGGQPYQPVVIRWETLQPLMRKADMNANETEWSLTVFRGNLTPHDSQETRPL